jgi:uncharacterized integral membrane protein
MPRRSHSPQQARGRGIAVWIIKGLLFLIVLIGLVYLGAVNQQLVDIKFFGKDLLAISIFWVVGASGVAGAVSVYIFAAFREFRFHREIRALKKAARLRDKEIADLRTIPIRETEPQPAEPAARKEAAGD